MSSKYGVNSGSEEATVRDDEPYMPKLDWQPHKEADHIYNVFIDGKQVCHIAEDTGPVWRRSGTGASSRIISCAAGPKA